MEVFGSLNLLNLCKQANLQKDKDGNLFVVIPVKQSGLDVKQFDGRDGKTYQVANLNVSITDIHPNFAEAWSSNHPNAKQVPSHVITMNGTKQFNNDIYPKLRERLLHDEKFMNSFLAHHTDYNGLPEDKQEELLRKECFRYLYNRRQSVLFPKDVAVQSVPMSEDMTVVGSGGSSADAGSAVDDTDDLPF